MLKFAIGSLIAGWLLLVLVAAFGHLTWDNRLPWGPPGLFCVALMFGIASLEFYERKTLPLLTAVLGCCSLLVYGVFYFLLIGLVGH